LCCLTTGPALWQPGCSDLRTGSLLLPTIDEDGVFDEEWSVDDASPVGSQASSFWSCQLSPKGPQGSGSSGASSFSVPWGADDSTAPCTGATQQHLLERQQLQLQLLLGGGSQDDSSAAAEAEQLLLAAIDLRLQELTRLRDMRHALKARAATTHNLVCALPASGRAVSTASGRGAVSAAPLMGAANAHHQGMMLPVNAGPAAMASASLDMQHDMSYAEQLLCAALGMPQPQMQQPQQLAPSAHLAPCAAVPERVWGAQQQAACLAASKLQQQQQERERVWALQHELLVLLQHGH
jgi:hypothetical protein